jgi:hypothetical protein
MSDQKTIVGVPVEPVEEKPAPEEKPVPTAKFSAKDGWTPAPPSSTSQPAPLQSTDNK